MENPLGGRYRLHERIGVGGMGEVWRATDEVLGRPVAVKVILAARVGDPQFLQRFLVEARAMASVRHPGVVAIHDFNGDDLTGDAYLVMELVDGESLAQLLARRGRLDPGTTMELVRQAALALQAVHDRGIVHRDVKPANLLIRPDGTAALTDFGIALPEDGGVTTTGVILGTPSYFAPEQVLGRPATPRTDVYSLGLVAYECVAGRRPFVGDNPFAVALQRAHQPPPPLGPEVPAAVAAVIDRALATDPDQRWATAAELADAAARAAGGATPVVAGAAEPTAWVGTASPAGNAATVPVDVHKGRRRLVAGIAVLAVLAVVAVAGLLLNRAPEGAGSADKGASTDPTNRSPSTTGPAQTASSTQTAETGPTQTAGTGPNQAGGPVAGVPTGPLCWAGLNIFGGVVQPLHRVGCDEPHYWETFAVAALPADAVGIRDDTLMSLGSVGGICSAAAMAKAARSAAIVTEWERDGVAYVTSTGSTVLLCIAGKGETTGSVFLLT